MGVSRSSMVGGRWLRGRGLHDGEALQRRWLGGLRSDKLV